jgi:hypothetical protein
VFSYEAVRDWEAKLTPALADSPQACARSGHSSTARAHSISRLDQVSD